jgi:outer membrane protein OmpA-like peptidoglycan-associated protein
MSDTTYHRINHDNHSKDSYSYSFWTWLIAIIAAIYLFWAWQHDRGPSFAGACCAGNTDVVAAAAPAATIPFAFSAGSTEAFESTGDATDISWMKDSVALKDWLNGGSDWKVTGDSQHVTLTGTVDSQATKDAKGAEAQAFFGENVTIDNQLTISEPVIAEPVAMEKPENAVVYFATSQYALPLDVEQTLAPVVEWVRNHPDAKVAIAGFHDPRGDKTFNIELSKNRAKSVYNYLINAGISADNLELRKPQDVEGDGNLSEARRTEVSIE